MKEILWALRAKFYLIHQKPNQEPARGDRVARKEEGKRDEDDPMVVELAKLIPLWNWINLLPSPIHQKPFTHSLSHYHTHTCTRAHSPYSLPHRHTHARTLTLWSSQKNRFCQSVVVLFWLSTSMEANKTSVGPTATTAITTTSATATTTAAALQEKMLNEEIDQDEELFYRWRFDNTSSNKRLGSANEKLDVLKALE